MLISILFSVCCFAQDLHFIYVRLAKSMDTETLKEQIEKLINSFSNSDYIVYYGNENTTMNKQSWNENKLFEEINSQNFSATISITEELENISVPLENQLQEKPYNTVNFHCFVGSDFFDSGYQNELLARMLIVNSLIQSKYTVSLQYYPCGASYNQEKTKFNPEYNINLITKIISSL